MKMMTPHMHARTQEAYGWVVLCFWRQAKNRQLTMTEQVRHLGEAFPPKTWRLFLP